MAVNSPGDALPCSIPQANAEKLRAIGATPSVTGTSSGAIGDGAREAQMAGGRTVPLPTNATVGRLLDLEA